MQPAGREKEQENGNSDQLRYYCVLIQINEKMMIIMLFS
jgi:hypothetical protein